MRRMGILADVARLVLRAYFRPLRIHHGRKISARDRLSDNEKERGILLRLSRRGQGRLSHRRALDLAREQLRPKRQQLRRFADDDNDDEHNPRAV